LSLSLSSVPPCSENSSDKRLRKHAASTSSASHTRSNDSRHRLPLAKTHDDASLNDERVRMFGATRYALSALRASASTASIRRCSLEKRRAPNSSKNWLGMSTSGSGL
jgi:hypothetical protein